MKNLPRPVLWVVLASAAALAGCNGCHSHDEHHAHPHDEHHAHPHEEHHTPGAEGHSKDEHDHGAEAVGITRYTDKLELFAEHAPAISGQELTFLAHLTILDGFQALESATVTLVLEGPTRVEATVKEKLRSGIFQPTLSAPQPGTYKGTLVVDGPQVKGIVDGFEIVVYESAEAAKKAAATTEAKGAEPISFLKEQQWQVPFATAFSRQGSVVPTIDVAGEVTTPPSGQADVSAAIAGRIVAPPGGLPRPGQAVSKGTLLATIAPAPAAPEEGARADLAVVEAEARAQSARAAAARAERLIVDRAISERELEDARRELGVAESSVMAARRARSVFSGAASGQGAGTYRVIAPIDGVVVAVKATAGKSVGSGELLLRLVNLSELWIQARVPEQDAVRLRADQDAGFTLPGLDAWLPLRVTGADATATVVNIDRTVDKASRTVTIIYGLRQPDERLRVGATVRVAVPAGDLWQGVTVPSSAVLDDDGRTIVYVQVEGESFEERSVQLGPRSAARVAVVRGLSANERVVTRGADVIRLASRSTPAAGHGHVH